MVITSIVNENKEVFLNLMPENISAEMNQPGWFALGALCPQNETQYAAGVLIFSVEEGSNGEEDLTAAVIQWLYVAIDFRRKSAAESMMRELFQILEQANIEHLLCDVPMPAEYNELCAYLESWGFEVSLTDVYETTVTVGELAEHPMIKNSVAGGNVLPLAKVPDNEFKDYINKAKKFPRTLTFLSMEATYYDQEVSCFYLPDGSIQGALLIKQKPIDNLEVVFMRASKNILPAMVNMLLFSVKAASKKYSLDTPVHIICRSSPAASAIDKLFPKLKPILVRRAYYSIYELSSDSDIEGGE